MSTEATIARLEKKIDTQNRKIDMLIEKAYRPLMVKASVITGLTKWNHEKMRQARDQGLVKYEVREKDGKKEFFYDLNSLDNKFIKR